MGKRYSLLTDLPHLFLSSDNGTCLLEQRFSNTAPQPFLTTFFILKTTAIPLWCFLLSAYQERLERKAPSLSLVSSLLEKKKRERERFCRDLFISCICTCVFCLHAYLCLKRFECFGSACPGVTDDGESLCGC